MNAALGIEAAWRKIGGELYEPIDLSIDLCYNQLDVDKSPKIGDFKKVRSILIYEKRKSDHPYG